MGIISFKKFVFYLFMLVVLSPLHQLAAQQSVSPADSTPANQLPGNVVIQDSAKSKPIPTNPSPPTVASKDSLATPKRAEKLIATFDTTEIVIDEGEMFSKNVRIVSNYDSPISFRTDVSYPAEWKSLANANKVYHIQPHDTLYIPIHLVPLGKVIGNTKYMINVFLFDTIGAPITSSYIYAAKPKLSKWTLDVGPQKKIYFKNDSTQESFTVNVGNDGTEPQDLYLSFTNIRNDLIVLDSANHILKKPIYSFTIKQYEDTTFHFKVKAFSTTRNRKRLDSDGYRMGILSESKSYSLFIRTTERSLVGKNARQMSKKVDFVQLPNAYKVSEYGMYSLPMIMDFNMSNLFSNLPISYLTLRGSTFLNTGAMITYNLQFIEAFNVNSNSVFVPPYINFGYFDAKWSILVGDVGGGVASVGVGGKGVSANYKINKRHRVGAYAVVNAGAFSHLYYYGAGVNYFYTGDKIQATVGYAHTENLNGSSTANYGQDGFGANIGYTFMTHQSIGVGLTLVNNQYLSNNYLGWSASLGYNASFVNSRLLINLTGSYFSNYYAVPAYGARYLFNNSSSYRINKRYTLRLTNSFNQQPEFINNTLFGTNYKYTVISNTLSTGRSIDEHSTIGGGIVYNILSDDYYNYLSYNRGVSFTYNYSRPDDYVLFSTSTQFGFNKIVSEPGEPDLFFMSFFTLVKYRVWSVNMRYTDGLAQGIISQSATSQNNSTSYAQNFAATISEQYQFINKHFILNNQLTYSLLPEINRNSFGYTPELNYYTRNGWRFRITAGYYLTTSPASVTTASQLANLYNSNSSSSDNQNTTVTSVSYSLMLGVRKDFGIPLPFVKKRNPTLNFISFIDINGNGKLDYNETVLENVVVRVKEWEVLTNDKGEAQMKNVPEGEYNLQAFSLVDLKEFYPNIPEKIKVVESDSMRKKFTNEEKKILIPFVQGVKLVGRVYVDREKLSVDAMNQLDLSGIKITAVNGHKVTALTDKDGAFMFYMPYGKYIVSMDEKVLGDRLRVLQNDLEVTLDKGVTSMFVSFYVAENQRKIVRKRFGKDGKLIQDEATESAQATGTANAANASNPTNASSPGANASKYAGHDLVNEANAAAAKVLPRPAYDAAKDAFLADKVDATATKGLVYTIQLGAFQKPLNPNFFTGFKNLMYERIDKDFVRITVGNISTEAEAEAEKENLRRVGFPNAFISVYYDGKNISLAEAAQIKKGQNK